MKSKRHLHPAVWLLRLVAAVILLQTLYFKFSAAEESVFIFSTLGMEPWGRIGTGLFELVAAVLLLIPRTTPYGALLGMGLMSGALFFHLTTLGIVVKNDGGQLFVYALLVFFSSLALVLLHLPQLKTLLKLKNNKVYEKNLDASGAVDGR